MKNCAYIKSLLFDYASGKLEDGIAERVKKHIDECEECRKEYEAQKLYFENLPYVSEYFVNLQKDIKTPVMQKIVQEKENPPIYIPKRFHFSYGTAASVVLVAAIFIFAMKTGIADKRSFDSAKSEIHETVDTADEEAAVEEYGYLTADYTDGTGLVNDNAVYFSASTSNDVYHDKISSAEQPEERIMMMAAPPELTTESECVTESAQEPEAPKKAMGTQYDEIPRLTLEKLREIVAEKGDKMTWSDFEGYEHNDAGSGIYILHYPISEYFCLTVSGVPDSEPWEIRLVSEIDRNDYIKLPDGDIDGFINRTVK